MTLVRCRFKACKKNCLRSEAAQRSCIRMVIYLLLAVFSATLLQNAQSLSYSVCDTILEEFTTDTPTLTGTWPYYNILYT